MCLPVVNTTQLTRKCEIIKTAILDFDMYKEK